jgi:hypothetical protein
VGRCAARIDEGALQRADPRGDGEANPPSGEHGEPLADVLYRIGLAIASSGTYVRHTVFSVFIAWAVKATILRFGGATLYRRYRPFFLGVLTGYTFGVALSTFIDAIWFPGAGHPVHGY